MATSLRDVEDAIGKSSADWKAEETDVVKFLQAPVGDMALFGLNLSDTDAERLLSEARSSETQTFRLAPPPPAAVDWRGHQGVNYVTPVRNQGNCGSCVAFATCAAIEARMAIADGTASPQIDLSEAHLFFCGCGHCCNTGWQPDLALNWARTGIGEETDFPYTPRNQPCNNPTPNPVVTVPSWSAATTQLARKQAIADNGPVIAALRVYEDFYFYRSGVYQHVTGIFRGLHAVCIVGYKDGSPGYWIMKNSWGTGWGQGGFMYIAYGECDIDSTYPFFDPSIQAVSGAIV
ncbi:MAG: hypothetical protein QOD74_1927 [Variibacter sp.]|jgi:C1A family cysteine protease|nr:hypothetical protein [Variibacter sp.]